jgi:hypothetical protein
MLLSILIPTLASRRTLFERISATLRGQIHACGWDDRIEIVTLADEGELPTGTKRNLLMQRARGEFIASVDDDDDVSDRYVELVGKALLAHSDVDCLGIRGEITYRGRYRRAFVYSAAYRKYQTVNGVYLRPPHHLNPIRRTIALRFPFLDVRRSEDAEWALRIARAGALQREHFIDHSLYRYYSRRWWLAQWAIDRTERIRHPLGLQLVNRLILLPPPPQHHASTPRDVAPVDDLGGTKDG